MASSTRQQQLFSAPSEPSLEPPRSPPIQPFPSTSHTTSIAPLGPPYLVGTVPLKQDTGAEAPQHQPQNKKVSWRSFVPSLANLPGILLALSTVGGFILFMVLGKYLAGPLTHLSDFVKARGVWYAIFLLLSGLIAKLNKWMTGVI